MNANIRRGFTFIDLMFVAVILSATFALIYPLLSATQESRRQNTCLYNIKMCGQALKLYADDYDGTMPSSGVVAASPTPSQVIDFLTTKGDPFFVYQPEQRKTWPQFLQDHMRSYGILYCPCERPRSRVSYWYKYANDLAWRDPALRMQHMGDYGYETDQIAFYEHAGWHTGDAAGIKNGVTINVVYMDTHVGTITVSSGPASYPSLTDERTGASAVRLGLPMYYNCMLDNNGQQTIHSPGDYINPNNCYDKP